MRVQYKFACWGVAAVLAGNLGRLVYLGMAPHPVSAAPERPYTVVRTENGFDKDGNLRYTNQYIEAVRSDGSKMWKATTPLVQQRRIYFASGDEVLTNEILGRKSTYPKKHASVPGRRDPAAACYNETDAKNGWVIDGMDNVSGHRVVRLAYTGAERTWQVWHAPDAGCAVVQMRFEQDKAVTLQNLTSLTFAEPDASLFEAPAFEETPPSRLFDRICRDGKCTAPVPEEQKQRLDKQYFEMNGQPR